MKDDKLFFILMAAIIWTFIVWAFTYSVVLDSVNEDCVKTGHFYVIDNVFECKLIESKMMAEREMEES
jgi:hypothetical protein